MKEAFLENIFIGYLVAQKENDKANVLVKLKKTEQNNAMIPKGWNMSLALPFNEDGYWLYPKGCLTIGERNGYELE